jgi:very-short-patch-repair endonuclease
MHLLNDPGIKFNFQQCVRRDGDSDKYALMDLYLPQFNIAIEVDEEYHKTQLTADEIRQREIEANIKPEIMRIDCSQGIDKVNEQIDECVDKIKKARGAVKTYKAWDGLSGYEHYRKEGYLRLCDDTELSSPTEICNIFGILKAPQRGSVVWWYNRNKSYRIWWPRENYGDASGNVSGDWYNKMEDKNTIVEYANGPESTREAHLKNVIKDDRPRIVFYAKRNMLNERLYRYVGVFTLNKDKSESENKCIWEIDEKLSEEFKLPDFQYNVDEGKALDSLNDVLAPCLSKIEEIKQRIDKWRSGLNQGKFDIISDIENVVNEFQKQEGKRQKRNGILTKLLNLLQAIKKYEGAQQNNSGGVDVDYNDDSLDCLYKILTQIDSIYEDWCRRQTNIALLKPHILPLYAINDEAGRNNYICAEILPEWIKLKTLEASNEEHNKLKNYGNTTD